MAEAAERKAAEEDGSAAYQVVQPVEHQANDDPRGEKVPAHDGPQNRGTPAGQLVIGALSTLVLGGWVAWEWLGLAGLLTAGGAAAAAGGGYGYLRWRSAHGGDAKDLASALGFGRSHRSRPGSSLGDSLSSGGGVGRRMAFSTSSGGRRSGTSSRIPSPFTSAGSGGTGRRVPLSRAPGSTPAGRAARQTLDMLAGGPSARSTRRGAFRPFAGNHRQSHPSGPGRTGQAARGVRAAMGRTARRARTHGRAINSEWTQAARHLSSQAGRGFQHAARRMRGVDNAWTASARTLASATARRTGRIARWFDRRTGRITSLGWKSLAGGDQAAWDALRSAYRRWDAQVLFGLLAATEWATRGLRSWWKRRHPAPATTEEAPPPESPLNPTRLIISGTRPLYRRNTSMSGLIMPGGPSPLVAMSAEMVAGVARFLPPDMWWVAADLDQLDQVTGNVAAALRTYARNLSAGYPVDPRIVDMFEEFANTVGKTSDYPLAIATAFRTLHEADIKRRLAPRTNEHLWNV